MWDILYGLWIGQSRLVFGLQAPGLDDTAHDLVGLEPSGLPWLLGSFFIQRMETPK